MSNDADKPKDPLDRVLSCKPPKDIVRRVDELRASTGLRPAAVLELCLRAHLPRLEAGELMRKETP